MVFREKLHKRVVAEQKRLTEARKKIKEQNRKAEERLIAYKIQEKQRLSVPPPPKQLVKKPARKKKQQDNSKLKERIEEHVTASKVARSSLAKFKTSGGGRHRPQAASSASTARSTSKFTFLERQRYLEALKQQMTQKFKDLELDVPPICSCGNTASPLDPMCTYYCANNCPLFRNEEQQHYLLRAYLSAHENAPKSVPKTLSKSTLGGREAGVRRGMARSRQGVTVLYLSPCITIIIIMTKQIKNSGGRVHGDLVGGVRDQDVLRGPGQRCSPVDLATVGS